MKNFEILSLFPGWKPVTGLSPINEEDAVFFDQLREAAREAEQKYGPALVTKYGPKMPTANIENPSVNADRIANDLGGKVLRR